MGTPWSWSSPTVSARFSRPFPHHDGRDHPRRTSYLRGMRRDPSRPRLDRPPGRLAHSRLPPLRRLHAEPVPGALQRDRRAGHPFCACPHGRWRRPRSGTPRPTRLPAHQHLPGLWPIALPRPRDRGRPPPPERIPGTHHAPAALPRLRPRTSGSRLARHRTREAGLLPAPRNPAGRPSPPPPSPSLRRPADPTLLPPQAPHRG